ncbi:MAG: hypothetical protein U0X39_03155 [Bacteroidales bacterium]
MTELIVSTLDKHEEHYILGSWESFVRHRARKKRFLFWITGTGIAASFLAGWLGLRLLVPASMGIVASNAADLIIYTSDENILGERTELTRTPNQITGSALALTAGKMSIPDPEAVTDSRTDERNSSDDFTRAYNNLSVDYLPFHFLAAGDQLQLVPEINQSEINPAAFASVDNANDTRDIKPRNEGREGQKRLRFGINISPGITSTPTALAMNYGGGINADILIHGDFAISTGLQLEQHNVVNKSVDNPAWLPRGESRAMLTALDLPVNLTWKFREKRGTSYYLSGGFSSVAWLGEKYENISYSQKMVPVVSTSGGETNVSYAMEDVKNTEKSSVPALSTVDLAGRINVLFGYEQRVSTRLFLHVEPYLKIPVTGQASGDLRYTISGITCKVSF